MKKKGVATWISAVLYFGLGIIILTIVLTSAMPVIKKVRDKNIALQSKEMLVSLDSAIREVYKGVGSKRVLSIEVKKGKLYLLNSTISNKLENLEDIQLPNKNLNGTLWQYKTTSILTEPGDCSNQQQDVPEVTEGNLHIRTCLSDVEGEYIIQIWTEYENIVLTPSKPSITGFEMLTVSNDGTTKTNNKIKISIKTS